LATGIIADIHKKLFQIDRTFSARGRLFFLIPKLNFELLQNLPSAVSSKLVQVY